MQIREDLGPIRRRSVALMAIVFVAMGALYLRFVELQLFEGLAWRQRAENNRLRRVPVASRRGRIYDRRGQLLADNLPTWELYLFPNEARDLDETVLFLAKVGVTDELQLREQIDTRRIGRMAPLVVADNLTWQDVATVRAHQSDHSELAIVSGFRREYPFADLTAHAVGHLRPITEAEAAEGSLLNPNTLVGATGIESLENAFLMGEDGERFVVVSAVGQQLGIVREQATTAGFDLGVTIDLDLQRVAADALGENSGAVVALEPGSGAVRILYSAPSFNPNLFSGRMSNEDWRLLSEDPSHPLQNRAIQGVYPPGSTVKPLLALTRPGTEEVSEQWTANCRGMAVLHGHPFRCWRRSGHGIVALVRSLEVSCDVYYYLLGQRLGIDRMAGRMRRFGFEQRTGSGLPNESIGLVGTPDWSRRVRGTPWYPGEAVSVSIGQGPVLVTTLQLARAYAALANGGWLVTPYLVEPATPAVPQDLDLDTNRLAAVQEGLRLAIHGEEGTARSLRRLPMAGKTGTAQVARLQDGVDADDLPHQLRHHAWFVGWAPLDAPRLVVAVVVEHGGGGGSVAAPVAGKILQAALADEALSPEP